MKPIRVFHQILHLLNKSKHYWNRIKRKNFLFRTRFRSGEEHSPSSIRSSQRSTITTTHHHQHTHEQQPPNRFDRSTYVSAGDVNENGLSITNGSRHDNRGIYSNGRLSGRIPPQQQYTNGSGRNGYSHDGLDHRYNSTRYNEPENNKSLLLI